MDEGASLAHRQKVIKEVDARGIIATPSNSSSNELVMEAARKSIESGGREVCITYGHAAGVAFREY